MPDQSGLEAIAQELRDADPDCVLATSHVNGRAEIQIDPAKNVEVLEQLRERGYNFLASVHGVDYYPHEPRLGVIYELLDMNEVDRVSVKARVSDRRRTDRERRLDVARRRLPGARALRHVRCRVRPATPICAGS